MATNSTKAMPSWMVSQTGTSVVSLKSYSLKKMGYSSLEEWLKDPSHVYIGRYNRYVPGANESKWANKWPSAKYGKNRSIELYEEYVTNNKELMESLHELKGKTLGCWCHPEPCHGHLLQKLISKHCA